MKKIALIIPTLNELENIEKLKEPSEVFFWKPMMYTEIYNTYGYICINSNRETNSDGYFFLLLPIYIYIHKWKYAFKSSLIRKKQQYC